MKQAPFAVRRPKLVLLGWLAVLLVTGVFINVWPKIELYPTFKSMIAANDPDLPFDAKAKKMLGDDELIAVAVGNPKTVFDIPTLAYIDRLTQAIEKLPAVRKVYSLTRADDIRGRAGSLDADDLITELPKTQDDLARIEKEAFENPTYVNMIVAPDKKAASINIEMKSDHTTKEEADTVQAVYKIVDDNAKYAPPGVETHVSGFPCASFLGGTYMLHDMVTLSAGALITLTIIMFLVLRSWHGVAFTLFVSLSSVNVAFGIMALCGFKMTMPLSSVMAFMTAIGMEYSVYVAFAYQHAVQTGAKGRDKKTALAEAILDVRFTVLMSAACTTAAFGSMLTNPIGDLKLLGAFLGIGTLACCAAATTIIPAWISLFNFPVPPADKTKHRWLQSLVDRIGRADSRRPIAVLSGLAVLCGLGIVLLTHVSSDVDAMRYFRKDTRLRQDDTFIRQHMAGDALLPDVILAPDVDTFKDPKNLAKLDEVAAYAKSLPYVTAVVSHADHIKLMNEALHSGTPADYKLPDSKAAVEQYLLLHNEPDDFHDWIDPDYKMASVMVRMNTMSSRVLLDTEKKLEAFTKKTFPSYESNVVGTTLLVHRSVDLMATSSFSGLLTATVFIWLIMIIGFRSIKLGSIALIPTLPPALMVYATLPIIGHPLDPPTSITGAIALGIAIDDTTWFISTWIQRRRQAGVDNVTAVSQTLSAIGRPMVLSSMVLGSGFVAMLLSKYLVLFWLGLTMSIVAFWSIFWDVLCTPTVIRLIDPKLPRRFRRDVVP